MKGRNRFKKKCYICGVMVPANEGYLKKSDHEYLVHHAECKPKATKAREEKQSVSNEKDNILDFLEAKLIQRQLNGEPIDMLPKVIDYIKELKAKVST